MKTVKAHKTTEKLIRLRLMLALLLFRKIMKEPNHVLMIATEINKKLLNIIKTP